MAGLLVFAPFVANAGDSWEEFQVTVKQQAGELLAQWRTAAGEARRPLGDEIVELAVKADLPEAVLEVASGGGYPKNQVAVPEKFREVPLQAVEDLGSGDAGPNEPMPWVIRRINNQTLEAWQPSRGWLFDARGKVLNQARPPRRDGGGREWYGAFLPDGAWATTDLWENDQTLHVFSKRGKFLRELPSGKILPDPEHPSSRGGLIGWARSDAGGNGWVVSVGSEGGRGEAFVTPAGKSRALAGDNGPWKLCQPRDLGPKGFYIFLLLPSDDGAANISREEAGHGSGVGYPTYTWKTNVRVAGGTFHFGFWPDSHQVFIEREMVGGEKRRETWFFDENAKFESWIDAAWLGDAGASLLFLTKDNEVLTVDPKLAVAENRRFIFADGSVAEPVKIFDDLKLGFLRNGEKLSLARWE